jgi:hypothetical protein
MKPRHDDGPQSTVVVLSRRNGLGIVNTVRRRCLVQTAWTLNEAESRWNRVESCWNRVGIALELRWNRVKLRWNRLESR